jgi:hypothetical protein
MDRAQEYFSSQSLTCDGGWIEHQCGWPVIGGSVELEVHIGWVRDEEVKATRSQLMCVMRRYHNRDRGSFYDPNDGHHCYYAPLLFRDYSNSRDNRSIRREHQSPQCTRHLLTHGIADGVQAVIATTLAVCLPCCGATDTVATVVKLLQQ